LAKQKETTLAEALRKAAEFIRATTIYVESTDVPKKAKVPMDRNPSRGQPMGKDIGGHSSRSSIPGSPPIPGASSWK